MKILSLFDGISCARVALERAEIHVDEYYASEIDKYAIEISRKNYPDIVQVGSITNLNMSENIIAGSYRINEDIDLLIGGSPCQDLSIAKTGRKGLGGERSGLFYEYVRILNEIKPKYFILENVASMSKESRETISQILGIEPVMINASLVSAQNRKRLFWVGRLVVDKYEQVEIPQPVDRGTLLKDILEHGEVDRDKSYCIDASYFKGANWKQYKDKGRRQLVIAATLDEGTWAKRHESTRRVYSPDGLCPTIPTGTGGGVMTKVAIIPEATKKGYAIATDGQSVDLSFPNSKTRRGRVGDKAKNIMTTQNIGVFTQGVIRKLTPVECERLQGLPDGYTDGVSNTQRYKTLGNAFNVDVVAHILSHIK